MMGNEVKLLALDTSTEACSAALWIDGQLLERYEMAPRAHASLILAMVEGLLQEADLPLRRLDAVAFGRGPGAFTGVRIATGVVQGIAFGARLPVVPVSSLAALAQVVIEQEGCGQVLSAIDARMGEVYWGVYRADARGYPHPVGDEQVAGAAAVLIPPKGEWCGVGTGWASYGEALGARLGNRLAGVFPDRYPRASSIAKLGALDLKNGFAVSPDAALPVYLRNKVVHTR